jgi:integrase
MDHPAVHPGNTMQKPKQKPISSVASVEAAGPGWRTVTGAPGLLLHVKLLKRGCVSRTFAVRLPGLKRPKRGLGSYPVVTLAQARQLAQDAHRAFAQGIDPGVRAKRRQRLAEAARELTLGKAIVNWLTQAARPYKNPKSDRIRERGLQFHFAPLHTRDVAKITATDIANILQRLAPETAVKTHAALRGVFDFAAATLEPYGVRIDNPADPRRLRYLGWTPKLRSESKPLAAVHWRVMPSVVDELIHMDDVAAKCALLCVATGVRAGTARLAKWGNIDFEARTWTPPFADLKEKHHKRPFIVPLNDVALDALERARSSRYVFPKSGDNPFTEGDLSNFLRKLRQLHPDWRDPDSDRFFTLHGFRSGLCTWTEDTRRSDSALAELSLGHKVHGDVQSRYIRTGLISERRGLLDAWSRHLRGESAEVLAFPARLSI